MTLIRGDEQMSIGGDHTWQRRLERTSTARGDARRRWRVCACYPNGDGRIVVNGRDADEYFGREVLMMQIRAPMRLVEQAASSTCR